MTKKALNLAGFEELSQKLQLNLLYKDGVHVGKRIVNGLTVILFQLYGFYVEVHYTDYRRQISHIVTSGSSEILQPYLDQIHIRDLDKGNKKNL